jgi:hypothetical protein
LFLAESLERNVAVDPEIKDYFDKLLERFNTESLEFHKMRRS